MLYLIIVNDQPLEDDNMVMDNNPTLENEIERTARIEKYNGKQKEYNFVPDYYGTMSMSERNQDHDMDAEEPPPEYSPQ